MIAHFVYNLNSYSGAAFQALTMIGNTKYAKSTLVLNISDVKNLRFENKDGILIAHLPVSYLKRLFWIVVLFAVNKVRLVHLHGYVLSGILPALMLRKKIIMKSTLLGDDDLCSIKKKGFIHRFLVSQIDFCVAISSAIEISNKSCGSKKIKVLSVPNGVCVGSSAIQKDCSSPVFCTVGVITRRKRIKESIKYFKENYATESGSVLYVVGPTPVESNLIEIDRKYYDECIAEAGDLLGKKVFFLGKVNKDELADIYQRSLALLFFSEREGMPNCVLEAMSFNCVPVTTDIGGVAKDIIDERSGFVIDDLNENVSLADLVNVSLSEGPYRRILEKFDIKIIGKFYSGFYSSLLS